jgi:hypothetical protein
VTAKQYQLVYQAFFLAVVAFVQVVIFVQVFKAEYRIINAVVFLFYFEFTSFG